MAPKPKPTPKPKYKAAINEQTGRPFLSAKERSRQYSPVPFGETPAKLRAKKASYSPTPMTGDAVQKTKLAARQKQIQKYGTETRIVYGIRTKMPASGKKKNIVEKIAGSLAKKKRVGKAVGSTKAKVTAPKASLKNQIANARKAATPKKVASDANNINISNYKVQGTRTAMRNRMQLDRSRTASRAKNMESKSKKK